MKIGYCVTSDEYEDGFVGLRFKDGNPEVVFPHGYIPSSEPKEQRKDIFCLLSSLKRFSESNDKGDKDSNIGDTIHDFPLEAYQYIIYNFLSHGYYVEKETKYISDSRGKINWKKTIQKEQPHIQNDNVIYLKYQVTKKYIKENNLLTLIHKYVVYLSFEKFGWMFFDSDILPKKPRISVNEKFFIATLRNELKNTFNDSKKKLFKSMIEILQENDSNTDKNNSAYGVIKFQKVWENIIDHVFGESDKERYFPSATWTIVKSGKTTPSTYLYPDTVMKYNGKIYVLDAKYYKFGLTRDVNHLPGSADIDKQFTYGMNVVHMKETKDEDVYNAFIMPYHSDDKEVMEFVSVGESGWMNYDASTLNYLYVVGILVDTRYLMHSIVKHNSPQILEMANFIENSLEDYKTKKYSIGNTVTP